MEKNSLGLVFLGLVAIMASVGLVLTGTESLSGQVVESNGLTGFAVCGGTTPGDCPQGQNCMRVGSTRMGWSTRPVFGCRPSPQAQPARTPQRKCGVESYRLGPQAPIYNGATWKCYGRPEVTRSGTMYAQAWESMSKNECANACVMI